MYYVVPHLTDSVSFILLSDVDVVCEECRLNTRGNLAKGEATHKEHSGDHPFIMWWAKYHLHFSVLLNLPLSSFHQVTFNAGITEEGEHFSLSTVLKMQSLYTLGAVLMQFVSTARLLPIHFLYQTLFCIPLSYLPLVAFFLNYKAPNTLALPHGQGVTTLSSYWFPFLAPFLALLCFFWDGKIKHPLEYCV